MKILRVAVATFIALLTVGCTNETGAVGALRSAGYKDIRMTGYRFFMCSQDDLYATGFTATGPSGLPISGAVCEAPLKGKTIRLD